MKKRFLISILPILVAVSFIVGFAACGDSSDGNKSMTSDGLELELEGNVYKITGLGGCKDSDVVIPSECDGKAVAYVDDFAFYNCDSLTSVYIPDSVISIGDYAFYSCDALKSVTIPKSVTRIGEYAFYGCTALEEMNYGPVILTELYDTSFFYAGRDGDGIAFTMGSEVSEIPANLFYPYDGNALYAPKIKTVDYEEGCACTVIGRNAFYDCDDLVSISLPDSVTMLGDCAFYDCRNLVSVTIPKSLTSIGNSTFYNCSSLEHIYYDAADYTSSLANRLYHSEQESVRVTIGRDVTKIASNLFSGFYSLTDVEFEDPDTCEEIGYDAFYGCSRLEYIAIPDSVTTIGDYAFYNCTSLGNAAIPDGVETVGAYAFYNCRSLRNVSLGANVSYIGSYAFYNCYNLTSVTIGAEVSTIGSYAFYNCYKLIEVENRSSLEIVPGSTGYGYVAYYAENVYMTNVGKSFLYVTGEGFEIYDDGDTAYVMGYLGTDTEIKLPDIGKGYGIHDYAFYNLASVRKVTTGDDATSVGSYAFYGCTSLESVSTGSGITSVGTYAFGNCTSLTSLTMGSGVTSVGNYAFYDCTALEIVAIPDSVTQIGNNIFSGCSSLRSVSTGNGITEINSSMFAGCYSLESVTIGSKVRSIGSYAFQNCMSLKTVNIPNSVTSIGAYAFSYCTSLSSVAIPASVTSVREGTFYYCTSLSSVTIPDSVTSIGSYAFYYCTSLSDVTIPGSVTSVETYAFYGCTSLSSLTIGAGIASLGNYAFYDCYALEEIRFDAVALSDLSSSNRVFYYAGLYGNGITVTIGKNVTRIPAYLFNPNNSSSYAPRITSVIFEEWSVCESIGSYALYGCAYLTDIAIPDSVTSIESYAFYGCSSLSSLAIGGGVATLGNYAFCNCYVLEEIRFDAVALSDLSSSNRVFYYAGLYGNGITVTIGKNVTRIPAYLFNPYNSSYAIRITSVIFEEGSVCESIGTYAFCYCSYLTSVVIPANVTSIETYVFQYCSNLTRVFYGGSAEDWTSKVSVGSYNTYLTSATMYYYSEDKPSSDGNFWHYVDGEPVVWNKEN